MNTEYIFHGDCEHMGYISDNRSFICKIINMVYIYIYGIHIYILYNHKSIDGMYPLVMTHGLLENPRTK